MIDQRAILYLHVILRAAEFQQHVFAAGRDECPPWDDTVAVLRFLDFDLADLVQARGRAANAWRISLSHSFTKSSKNFSRG